MGSEARSQLVLPNWFVAEGLHEPGLAQLAFCMLNQ